MRNILPSDIANELKENGFVKPAYFEKATIMFTDFVGFTKIAESMEAEELVEQLDGCFYHFDETVSRYGLEKLKTIGDAYMCAGGLPSVNQTHPIDVCLAAIEIQSFMKQTREIKKGMNMDFWRQRIGIHTGPVIAGVIGKNKFAYDVWGDAVNVASRMESAGEEDQINISADTYELVKDFFECAYRGELKVKNKGKMGMYFLLRIHPHLSVSGDGRVPNKEFLDRLSSLKRND